MIFLILISIAGASEVSPRVLVTEHMAEIQSCYIDKSKSGKLIVSWTIDEHGQAIHLKSRLNELKDEKLYECISKKIQGWHFTPSKKPNIQNFLYPFVFGR